MVRTQIQFTTEQIERLKQEAAAREVSMSQVVRDAVDGGLPPRGDRIERALKLTEGKFRSGRSDISENHDDYLADAFLDQKSD